MVFVEIFAVLFPGKFSPVFSTQIKTARGSQFARYSSKEVKTSLSKNFISSRYKDILQESKVSLIKIYYTIQNRMLFLSDTDMIG